MPELWYDTKLGYETYRGDSPPICPHCKMPITRVIKRDEYKLRWNKVDKTFSFNDHMGWTYYCNKCNGEIKGIGIMGVDMVYREKGEKFK
jgi:hypothetical protein